MIIKANSLHIPLKDESIHCVITSPPYYGLRKYQIPDSIWGGDSGCDHQWGELLPSHHPGQVLQQKDGPNKQGAAARGQTSPSGQFCLLCSAWRGQLGLEPTIDLYVSHLVQIFREVRRVLRSDGTLWLNLGDSYASGKGSCYNPGGGERSLGEHLKIAGVHNLKRSNISDLKEMNLKPKDLCEIPSEVVRALRSDGWWLRERIPWLKFNSMPSSCTDRPTVTIEYIFLLTKSRRYFYDQEAVRMPAGRAKPHGKNSRMNVDRDPAHLPPYRSGNKVRKIADGDRDRVNDHLGSSIPWEDSGAGRYRRDSDWFFESLKGLLTDDEGDPLALIVNPQPYKGSHYACFPEKLVEPMIKAGTSAKGCCPKCGAPWERIIEKGLTAHDGETTSAYQKGTTANRLALLRQAARERGEEYSNQTKTIGWEPTCSCDAGDPVPCVILDPFSGSGTTLRASEKLRRRAVGLDLGYHGLSQHRTKNVQRELML